MNGTRIGPARADVSTRVRSAVREPATLIGGARRRPAPVEELLTTANADLELLPRGVRADASSTSRGAERASLRRRHVATMCLLAAILTGCAGSPAPRPGTETASPTSSCLRADGGCLGVLPAGTFSSLYFDTFRTGAPGQLTYTTTDGGWANSLDHSPAYWFQRADLYVDGSGDDAVPGVLVWGDVAAAAQAYPSCPESAEPGGPTDPDGLAAWMRALPGVVSEDVPPLRISGVDVPGFSVRMDPATAPRCSWGQGVTLIAGKAGAPDPFLWAVGGTEVMHVYLWSDGSEHTVAILIDSPDESGFDELVAEARPLIESFAFTSD